MFNSTKSILEKTEAYILNLPSENKLWSVFTRYIVFPFKYLALGFRELVKPMGMWAGICMFFLFSILCLHKILGFSQQFMTLIFCFSVLVSFVLVIFSVPSTYSYYGVKNEHVRIIEQYIKQEGINTISEIELLEKNLEKIYQRISLRVSFYKWFIGVLRGSCLLIINTQLKVLSVLKNVTPDAFINNNAIPFGFIIIFSIFALVIIASYKRASDLTVKIIEFGCNDVKAALLKNIN